MVETDNGKSYFTFDNVVDEKCTQSHLYELIGKSILEATLKVGVYLCRDITVVCFLMDRLELARLIRYLVGTSVIVIRRSEGCYQDSLTTYLSSWGRNLLQVASIHSIAYVVATWRYTMNKYSIY